MSFEVVKKEKTLEENQSPTYSSSSIPIVPRTAPTLIMTLNYVRNITTSRNRATSIPYDTTIHSAQSFREKIIYSIKCGPFFEDIEHYAFVVPHFDIDVHEDKYSIRPPTYKENILNTLNIFKEELGAYDIAGYARDIEEAEFFNVTLRNIPDKPLSLHVVFYTTKICKEAFLRLQPLAHHLNQYFDSAIARKGRCLFRHAFSDKVKKDITINTADTTMNDERIGRHILMPIDQNFTAVREELFNLQKTLPADDGTIIKESPSSSTIPSTNQPEKRDEDQLIEQYETLLSSDNLTPDVEILMYLENIENNVETLKKVIGILKKTPFPVEIIDKCIRNWWIKGYEENPSDKQQNLEGYLHRYYERMPNPYWRQNLLKYFRSTRIKAIFAAHLHPNIRRARTVKDVQNYINENIFYLSTKKLVIERNENAPFGYTIMPLMSFAAELRLFMPKNIPYPNSPDNGAPNAKTITYTANDYLKYMADFKTKRGLKFNENVLSEREAEVSSDYFYIFRGFEYPLMKDASDEEIFDIIKPHYDLSVCITNREVEAEFLWTSLSYVFKYPGLKNGVFVILKGPQGAGKNMFLDVFGHIAGEYGNLNGSLEELTADFNAHQLENKIIVICSEIRSTSASSLIMEKLKKIITDFELSVNEKYLPKYDIPNVSNFFGATNSDIPILLDNDDRRFVTIEINNSKVGNKEFFKKHSKLISTTRFRSALLTYCIRKDVGKDPLTALYTKMKERLIINNFDPASEFMFKYFEKTKLISWVYQPVDPVFYNLRKRSANDNLCQRTISETYFQKICTEKIVRDIRKKEIKIYTLTPTTLKLFCNILSRDETETLEEQASLEPCYIPYKYTSEEKERSENLKNKLIEAFADNKETISRTTVRKRFGYNLHDLMLNVIDFDEHFIIDFNGKDDKVLRLRTKEKTSISCSSFSSSYSSSSSSSSVAENDSEGDTCSLSDDFPDLDAFISSCAPEDPSGKVLLTVQPWDTPRGVFIKEFLNENNVSEKEQFTLLKELHEIQKSK
jgi:hypothetical protein